MHFRARNKHSRFNHKKKRKKKKRKKETIAHFIETYLKLTSVDTTLAWIRLTSASVSTSAICLPFVSSCQVRLHEIERAKKKRREREREEHRILNVHVGTMFDTRKNNTGRRRAEKVKRNESTMMCSNVAHERAIHTSAERYLLGKERELECGEEERVPARRGLCNLYLGD